MAVKKDKKEKKKPRISQADQLASVFRVGVPVLAALAAVALGYILVYGDSKVVNLHVSDAVALKRVFFSGEPWLVFCLDSSGRVPEHFKKASSILAGHQIQSGALNCSEPLPSGKTTLQKFGLSESTKPVAFFVANGNKPKQLDRTTATSKDRLVAFAQQEAELKIFQLRTSADLRVSCLNKRSCVLVAHTTALEDAHKRSLANLMKQHRNMTYAVVDMSQTALDLGGVKLSTKGEGPWMVCLRKRSSKEAKDSKATLGYVSHTGPFKSKSLAATVRRFNSWDTPPKWTDTAPTLSAAGGSSSSSRGSKPAKKQPEGDGRDRDARRRNRDQARAKASQDASLSPEEKLEREKQRRKQMDEESKEWFQDADEGQQEEEEETVTFDDDDAAPEAGGGDEEEEEIAFDDEDEQDM